VIQELYSVVLRKKWLWNGFGMALEWVVEEKEKKRKTRSLKIHHSVVEQASQKKKKRILIVTVTVNFLMIYKRTESKVIYTTEYHIRSYEKNQTKREG
jgi:hypothetical protein